MDAEQWRRDILRKMRSSRAATLRLFDRINARMMIKPETQGKWSVKDVFAHFIAWEKEACKRLDLILDGRADRIYFYDEMSAIRRFNSRAVSEYRSLSMNQLLREAAEIRTVLIRKLKKIPAIDVDNPSHRYTVSEWLTEFAYTHEKEHRERIQKWLSERNKAAKRKDRN